MIQSLISNDNASYDWTNLRSTLIGFPVILIVYLLNVYAAHKMPLLQNMMLILYVFGFIVIMVTMLVLSPRIEFGDVFTQFSNTGGYSTMGLSLMVGQLTPIFAFLCTSGSSHLPRIWLMVRQVPTLHHICPRRSRTHHSQYRERCSIRL